MTDRLTPLHAAQRIAKLKAASVERAAQWLIGCLAEPSFGIVAAAAEREFYGILNTGNEVFSERWQDDVVPSDYWQPGHAAHDTLDCSRRILGDLASFPHNRFVTCYDLTASAIARRFPAHAERLAPRGLEAIEERHDLSGVTISDDAVDKILATDQRRLERMWRNLNDRSRGPLEPTRATSRAFVEMTAQFAYGLLKDGGHDNLARNRSALMRMVRALDGGLDGYSEGQAQAFVSAINELAERDSK